MEKVFLVDAYALIFRFYYAFIGRPMRNAAGVNTSAVFGFVKFLKDLILRERPHYLGVAFDPPGGNFRHELYADYKANRSETPEDIVASVPYIKQVLEAMRIPVLEIPGYEADDVIGTLSQKAAAAGYEVFMVTPDKDYGQLIRPAVRIYKQRKGGADGIEIIGCEQIREHYGIDDPCRVIDVLALWGDASDNIPGVQGIGEKSAIKLVCQFGTVENLLAHTELLSGKQRVNIEAARDQIMLAKRLATIRLDVPVEFEPEKLRLEAPDTERLAEAYRELGFRSFLAELRPGARSKANRRLPFRPATCSRHRRLRPRRRRDRFSMRRPIRRSTPCRMSIIRSRTRRLCASWPAGWRLRPNSASTRRRPDSTCSATDSWACRSPWSRSRRGTSRAIRRTSDRCCRSCAPCSRTSGSPRSARTSSSI